MTLEDKIDRRLNNPYWIKRTHEIVKYSPDGYDKNGVYHLDEWSSVYDIGKSFSGIVLTEDAYQKVENDYIDCAVEILTQSDCKFLTIGHIEDYDNIGYNYKSRVSKTKVATILRDMLREKVFCVLINLKRKVMIYVEEDYYMHIDCPIDIASLKALVEIHNLHLNPRAKIIRKYIF